MNSPARPTRRSARASVRQPTVRPTWGRSAARDGPQWGISRALAILQKRPRTSPELQLSTNTISPSLKPFHLTPWLSWNSPAHTPSDSAHGGATAGDTTWLRRSPRTYGRPPNRPITISNPSGYAKRRCGVTQLAGKGCRPNWLARELG